VNCDEAETLLGAYALDALPDGEAAAMRAHIEGCAEHAAKAAELRAVAVELPALADPVAAPPLLRARVLDAIAREAASPPAAVRSIAAAAPRNRVLWRPANTRVFSPVWGSLAAALVIAIGGLLAWNLVLQNRNGASVDRLASRATSVATLKPSSGGAGGTVVYFASDKKALVITDGLTPLDASAKTYQMWALHGDQAESIGLMQADTRGHAATVVSFDAARTGAIAITIEPAGGSPQPTSSPILTATCVGASANCAG
jgi:anti-sigma-K factor RskA